MTWRSFMQCATVASTALAVAFGSGTFLSAQQVAPPPAGLGGELEGNAEVLTRGPVHEAFAEPYTQDPEPGLIIPREPPDLIEELPPEAMPEGVNVEWIPGYWAWDDDREDFIWISGLWRDVPPGQRWVPGSWVQVSGGFQWTAGFWTSVETQEIAYLPEPPPSEEVGPNVPAPDDNHFWVPGTWEYQSNDYAWRPGYWAPAYDNWVWVPARHVWTPRGFIFVNGYWDYDVVRRGVLFSPVFFPGYRYPRFIPRHVVSIGPLMIHLFVRPRYNHYYFGDYYGDPYLNAGIVPWIGVRQFGFYQYDPLFAFYQTGFFNVGVGGGFLGRVWGWHDYYRRHPDFRPRRTLADAREFARVRGDRDDRVVRQAVLTESFDDFRRSPDREVRFRDLEENQRESIVSRSREVRELQQQRRRHEVRAEGRQAEERLTLPRVERRGPTDAGPRGADRDAPGRETRPDRPESRPERDPRPERGPGLDRDARPDDARPDDARPERVPPRPERDARPERDTRPQPERQPQPDVRPRPDAGRQPDLQQPGRETPRPDRGPDRGERPGAERPAPQPGQPAERPDRGGRRPRADIQIPDAPSDAGREARPIPRPSERPQQQERPSTGRGRSGGPDAGRSRGGNTQPGPQPGPSPQREAGPPAGRGTPGGAAPGRPERGGRSPESAGSGRERRGGGSRDRDPPRP